MELSNASFLRSLRNEAGRQADFFASRDAEVSGLWRDVESLAHNALTNRKPLTLIVTPSQQRAPIIKPCE